MILSWFFVFALISRVFDTAGCVGIRFRFVVFTCLFLSEFCFCLCFWFLFVVYDAVWYL